MTTSSTAAQHFEVPRWECVDLLRRAGIGRLCIIDHGCPVAFPVSVRMEGEDDAFRAVIRTKPATLIGEYEGPASLEVDDINLASGMAWSVIVRGTVQVVRRPHHLPDPEPLVAEGRDRWVELRPSVITGRRFTVRVGDGGWAVDWQLNAS